MKVILTSPRGFCAGVVRAIEIVEIALERFGPPIFVRHEIVHNQYVVDALRKKGAAFIEEIDEVPENSTVIFSAHGVAPGVWESAKRRNLHIIDATCPLVTKVHLESQKFAKEGYDIVVVGHEGHPEVIGTLGQSPQESQLVDTIEAAGKVVVKDPDRVVALTQTTLSVDDTHEVIEALRSRFPGIVSRSDICYATTNRQEATKALAARVDLVLVIGAQNSSNCNRLREVAQQAGIPSYLIDGAEDIESDWLEGVERVGITSGASTPEVLLEQVIDFLQPEAVSTLTVTSEDVTFVLPKEFQDQDSGKFAKLRAGYDSTRKR